MARVNVAIRTRDIKKAIENFGEGRAYSVDMIKPCLSRAVANYLGVSSLSMARKKREKAPGRPVGIRGVRKSTGRRSVDGVWQQVELDEVGEWLELCSEIIAEQKGWALRPSLAITAAIVAAKPPRPLDKWMCAAPVWAALAWIRKNPVEGIVHEELTLPIDDYDTTPRSEALSSDDDCIVLTEEQEKEIV